MKVLSPTDAAYIAGLIDGEGCISISRTHTNASAKGCKRGFAYRSSVVISMTDLIILKWVQHISGVGQICRKRTRSEKHKPAWSWAVWSIEAADLLKRLLPYLKIKEIQARNLIIFQSQMRFPGSKGLTDKEWKFREQRHKISLTLNKRGIAA